MSKVNLKDWFLEVAKGEPILGVVLGEHYNNRYEEPAEKQTFGKAPDRPDVLLQWEEAAPILDYEYDNSYGGADCHPAFVWTPTRVLFVHEYDGSTGIVWVPRNPTAVKPDFGGVDTDDEDEGA